MAGNFRFLHWRRPTWLLHLALAAVFVSCSNSIQSSVPGLEASKTPMPVTITATDTSTGFLAAITTPTPFVCAGQELLFMGVDSNSSANYYVLCEDGNSSERLSGDIGSAPSLSLTKKQIAFAKDDAIIITDLHGSSLSTIRLDGRVQSVAWSSDGEYVAYISGKDAKVIHLKSDTVSSSILPADFTHPHVAGMPDDPAFTNVAWSPVDSIVALSSNYDTLYLVNVECDDTTHLCSSHTIESKTCCVDSRVSWSPDGTRLAAICYRTTLEASPDFKLCLIDPTGKIVKEYSQTDLGTKNSLVLGSPVWSLDGKKIAVSDGEHILILSVETGSVFDVTDRMSVNPDTPAEIAWLP